MGAFYLVVKFHQGGPATNRVVQIVHISRSWILDFYRSYKLYFCDGACFARKYKSANWELGGEYSP